AQARLPEMTEAELALFEDFLLLPDPDLQDVIWGAGVPAQKFAGLVCEIRVSHGLDATP
ncbi:succinate dehydrogenase assembly factor 2, partial [Herbaspirillum sp. HC18]